MTISGYKILRILIVLLLLITIGLGVLNFIMVGFIDFPCFVEYNSAGDCIDQGSMAEHQQAGQGEVRIEAFLTTYIAGWSGGGCYHKSSDSETLDLLTSVGRLSLERDNETLIVNDKHLEKGAPFEKTRLFDWHPWIIAQTQFTNYGVVSDCQADPAVARLVVIGNYGTQTSLLKGFIITGILTAAFIFVNRKVKARAI